MEWKHAKLRVRFIELTYQGHLNLLDHFMGETGYHNTTQIYNAKFDASVTEVTLETLNCLFLNLRFFPRPVVQTFLESRGSSKLVSYLSMISYQHGWHGTLAQQCRKVGAAFGQRWTVVPYCLDKTAWDMLDMTDRYRSYHPRCPWANIYSYTWISKNSGTDCTGLETGNDDWQMQERPFWRLLLFSIFILFIFFEPRRLHPYGQHNYTTLKNVLMSNL